MFLVTALSWPFAKADAQPTGSVCEGVVQSVGRGEFGPFDYRTNRDKWAIVENVHFTPQVEALVRGQTGTLGQDIAYTLSVFPNHHRALLAAMRMAERDKTVKPAGLKYSIDCHFERAIGFARDDNVTRLLYAMHLSKTNRKSMALATIDYVVANAVDNAFTHFNAGQLYLELNEFEKALRQAHKAAELGIPSSVLKDRLQKAGKWQEPETVSSSDAARPPGSASSTAEPATRP